MKVSHRCGAMASLHWGEQGEEQPLPLPVSAAIRDSRHAQSVISHECLPAPAICHDL